MGRLVDESLLQEKLALIPMQERTFCRAIEELENAPTVEAIPKADIQKALKEGSKDISETVLAIVREEYISKVDYENCLKADMIDMLTELQTEIGELKNEPACCQHYKRGVNRSSDIVQQKINTLGGRENEHI